MCLMYYVAERIRTYNVTNGILFTLQMQAPTAPPRPRLISSVYNLLPHSQPPLTATAHSSNVSCTTASIKALPLPRPCPSPCCGCGCGCWKAVMSLRSPASQPMWPSHAACACSRSSDRQSTSRAAFRGSATCCCCC